MPSGAPATKIEGTRGHGAEVVLYDRATTDRDALGARLAAERGLTLVPPFDDQQVIAGQGTTGLELAAQAAEAGVDAADVLVCCGGGGLSAGIALALEAEAPGLRVRTAEPAGFDDMARSLAAGERLANAAASGSVCDAITTTVLPEQMIGATIDTKPSSGSRCGATAATTPVGSGMVNEKNGPATGLAPPNTAASLSVHPA